MFELEVFRKQIYCIEESTCDIFGGFRRPGNCAPLVTPLGGKYFSPTQPLPLNLIGHAFAPSIGHAFTWESLLHAKFGVLWYTWHRATQDQ